MSTATFADDTLISVFEVNKNKFSAKTKLSEREHVPKNLNFSEKKLPRKRNCKFSFLRQIYLQL